MTGEGSMPKRSPRLNTDDPMQGLALELRMLRMRAGNPPLTELARKMSCSHSTVSAYLNGRRLPLPEQIKSFALACNDDPADWQSKLEDVHQQLNRLPAQDALGNTGAEQRGARSGAVPGNDRTGSREVHGSPALLRRKLAAELREIRRTKGITGDTAAAALRWSPSKIGRYERGRGGLQPQDVERMLDYYEVTGARRALLLELAEDAAQKGWWEELVELSADYKQAIGLEHEASSISIWHLDVVPGLLQTEAYAREIISSYSRVEPIAPALVERLVRVRMRRQQVLNREPQPVLSVVLDESILHRQIGDELVMYQQLQRLAREADRPYLTLQILPLKARHTVFGESFVIFSFGAGDGIIPQHLVNIEHLRDDHSLEDERETHLYRIAFQGLINTSLAPASSQALILEMAELHWSGT
jgi:transcriptional regulator with XRE-family HTH domain